MHHESHPYEISMQILNERVHPHILGSSMKVSDRFFYRVKNWLWQWISRIKKNRYIIKASSISSFLQSSGVFFSATNNLPMKRFAIFHSISLPTLKTGRRGLPHFAIYGNKAKCWPIQGLYNWLPYYKSQNYKAKIFLCFSVCWYYSHAWINCN